MKKNNPQNTSTSSDLETMLKFLRNSERSLEREAILRHRFVYDLTLAATKADYFLQNYTSNIDKEGADIALSDGEDTRPIQLKAVFDDGATAEWEIHRNLFRPTHHLVKRLGFTVSKDTKGVMGAFVLQVLKPAGDSIAVHYEYCDLFLILAFQHGILRRKKQGSRQQTYEDFVKRLTAPAPDKTINVTRPMLVRTKSPTHLLALLGFRSSLANTYAFGSDLIEWLQGERDPEDSGGAQCYKLNSTGKVIFEKVQSLITDEIEFIPLE